MPKAIKKLNEKKAVLPKAEYSIHREYGKLMLKHNGDRIFSAYMNSMQCCAFNEVSSFMFDKAEKVKYSDKLQAAFIEYVQRIFEYENGSYQMFMLNRRLNTDKSLQPDWFVQCLENFPGAYSMPWIVNHTHRPVNTEVKAYFLPTPDPSAAHIEEEDDRF